MNENNELNDIILNQGTAANNNKKIILAVATLGVILIIVVMLMNSLTSDGTDNLPQAVLPPEPKAQVSQEIVDEPLFEEVEVVQEVSTENDKLEQIAQKLKEESKAEKKVVKAKKKVAKIVKPKLKKATGIYYIQVGSFSKYKPNAKFLKSIQKLGYSYRYHKVIVNGKNLTKVLVGPFENTTKAKDARRVLRAKIEPGAFLTKIK